MILWFYIVFIRIKCKEESVTQHFLSKNEKVVCEYYKANYPYTGLLYS